MNKVLKKLRNRRLWLLSKENSAFRESFENNDCKKVESTDKMVLKTEESFMKPIVLYYAKCSTCQKALKWLEEKGIDYEGRPIKEKNPTAEELKAWYERSGLPLKRFFNTSGLLYKEMALKDKLPGMSEEEQLSLLASDGMLVKRPLLVSDKGICPGFRESEWEKIITG